MPVYVRAIPPPPNRVRCREEIITLAESSSSYQYCTKLKIWTSIDVQTFWSKNQFCNVQRMERGQHNFCNECGTWFVCDLCFWVARVFDQQEMCVAFITMLIKSTCFVLHLSQNLSLATFAAVISTAFYFWNWVVHHVVVRHRNLISVRDVLLVSLPLTPWSSNSLRFKDHALMILLRTWSVQSFSLES